MVQVLCPRHFIPAAPIHLGLLMNLNGELHKILPCTPPFNKVTGIQATNRIMSQACTRAHRTVRTRPHLAMDTLNPMRILDTHSLVTPNPFTRNLAMGNLDTGNHMATPNRLRILNLDRVMIIRLTIRTRCHNTAAIHPKFPMPRRCNQSPSQ